MAVSLSKYDIVLHEQQHERDEQRKIRLKAMIGTVAVYVVLFLLILFIVVPPQDPPLDAIGGGGADIILGSDATGMNETFELVAAGPPFDKITAPKEQTYTPPQPQQQVADEQDFADADDEDAVAINKKESIKPKNETKPITTPVKENTKPAEEPPRKIDKRTLFETSGSGHNGTGGTGSSKGTGTTPGDQGSRNGSPDGGWNDGPGTGRNGNGNGDGPGTGPGFELGGRNAISLVQPENMTNEGGIVVVAIEVDQAGNVISVRGGVKGSTTTNSSLIAQAERAAKKAKFSAKPDAPEIQSGKIRYNFKLQ
ncbi:MAG: TonB family protein [Sphingobacteriales bacterium]|nr:MAG: TonB family protein [Sphingobacteriales bacterium]